MTVTHWKVKKKKAHNYAVHSRLPSSSDAFELVPPFTVWFEDYIEDLPPALLWRSRKGRVAAGVGLGDSPEDGKSAAGVRAWLGAWLIRGF